jgi:nitronate monooxygenase
VVSFHFGLPAPDLLARVKSWGSRCCSSATTVEEALWLQAHGVDAIIAQGLEAGGHRGIFLQDDLTTQLGTFALLPQVVRAVSCR